QRQVDVTHPEVATHARQIPNPRDSPEKGKSEQQEPAVHVAQEPHEETAGTGLTEFARHLKKLRLKTLHDAFWRSSCGLPPVMNLEKHVAGKIRAAYVCDQCHSHFTGRSCGTPFPEPG